MTTAFRGGAAALAIALVTPQVAVAQITAQPPAPAEERRPYRGIFGGPPAQEGRQSLVFSGSVFGAYDDNVLDDLTGGRARNWRYQRSGAYGGANAGLSYAFSHSGERLSFGAQGSGQANYYDRGGDSHTATYYNGAVGMDARLTRSLTLSASQGVAFMPGYSFLISGMPGADPAANVNPLDGRDGLDGLVGLDVTADPDLELFQLEGWHLTSRVALSQRIGRGFSATGGYGYRQVNFTSEAGDGQSIGRFTDYSAHSVFALLAYQRPMTQYATLNLGYAIHATEKRDRSGRPRVLHDIQAGVNYGRPISFSRRTSFRFSTGSVIAVRDDLSNPEGAQRMTARLTGNAVLIHELGRTWTARASYRRGLIYREGFDNHFFFTDSLGADLGGLITRRLSFSAHGAWSFARLDRPGRNGQTAFSGAAQTTFALSRFLGLYARYIYYQYEFDEDIPLDDRFPRALERHGVRVGLMTSIPLIR